ncbi:MAG: hypothetical protein JWN98_2037 [Abditibacteriota bacterium]|nr:hypothetical protein [Abditibacteriota bacterium]
MKFQRAHSASLNASINASIRTSPVRAFTLVEILIVLAIISLLAAILLPVLTQVRERARQSTCASNLKQIGVALLMYGQDYDETLPRWGSFASGDYISDLLNSYLQRKSGTQSTLSAVWTCPSRSADTDSFNSYGYNYLVLGNVSVNPLPYIARYAWPASLASLQEPTQTVAFADALDLLRPPYGVEILDLPDTAGSWHHGAFELIAKPGGKWVDGQAAARLNVLWADGHVKSLRRSALTPPSRGGSACNDDLYDRVKPSPYKFSGAPGCP